MKSYKNIILCFIAITILQGCNDLLNTPKPSDELPQDVTLNSASTVRGIRIKMYDRLHTWNYTALYMLGPDALADGFVEREGSGRLQQFIQNAYKAGMSDNFQYSSESTYALVYDLANDANTMLNGVPEGVLEDEELNRYKGEAYFFRAFAYFYLGNILGYMPGVTPSAGPGKDFKLSIILRTEPTLNVTDATTLKLRSTARQVYDQVESDLKQSIDLLSNNTAAQNASVNYVKAAAAEALLSRVYLYDRDYKQANKYAQDALSHTSARIATKSEVATMFDETTGNNPEAIFLLDVNPTTEGHGSDSVSGFTSTFWNSMMPSPHVLGLYSSNDVRRQAWYGPCYSDNAGSCASVNHTTDIELEKWDGELGHQTDDIPFFRVSEMLLIETEARLHDPSLGDPLTPINELRTNRGISALTKVTINDVLDERQREFIGEGQRFWDLKRLGRDIKKAESPDIPFTSFKLLDNIPDAERQINPDLTQNPGY